MNPQQLLGFEANSGFSPAELAGFILAAVFALLLTWGVWAIRSAYVGWAEQQLSSRQLLAVAIRFLALYLGLSFFLLSRLS